MYNLSNPKTLIYKKEISQTTKKNSSTISSNNSPIDDEKEKMKKEWEKIKNMDTTELDREYNLYRNSTIYY